MSTVLMWTGATILFFVFAWVARRLLGVRRLSTTRTLVSALVGLTAGVAIGIYMSQRDLSIDVTTLTALALALLFTMLTVIIFETVRASAPSPSQNRRSLFDRWSQVQRSAEVARIVSRHGLGEGIGLASGRSVDPEAGTALGIKLRKAFEEAGGVFVKLGQLLATRPDVVPPETAKELGLLHSAVAPQPRSTMEPVLEAGLGVAPQDVFVEFDWTPLGSASIGQVYRATTVEGDEVVVKVRRPEVANKIERDLTVLDDLSKLAEQRVETARSMGLTDVVREFSEQLRRELDYRIEAHNVEDVAHGLDGSPSIEVPAVISELSSETVLVMEFARGHAIGDLDRPPAGGVRLAGELFEAQLSAMLSGAAFHADLHPGNILLTDDTHLALVDFGAVGRLDAYERAAVTDILTALEIRDPAMLREAALEVGMRSHDIDETGLERSMARLMADHLGPERDPSVGVITEFLRISQRHGLRLPASISEMLRALATLDGSLQLLSPGFSLVAAARGFARQEMSQALSPETLSEDLKREVVRLAPLIRRAPHQLDRIAGQLARGEMGVRVSLFATEQDTEWLGAVVNRSLLAFLGAVLGIVSVMLFQTQGGPGLTDNISLFQLLGYVGLFGGAVLIMRVILEVLRDP